MLVIGCIMIMPTITCIPRLYIHATPPDVLRRASGINSPFGVALPGVATVKKHQSILPADLLIESGNKIMTMTVFAHRHFMLWQSTPLSCSIKNSKCIMFSSIDNHFVCFVERKRQKKGSQSVSNATQRNETVHTDSVPQAA